MSVMNDLIRQVELVDEQVCGDKPPLLIGIKPLMEYVNGESTKNRIGTRFEVILPSRKFVKITVKVPSIDDTKWTSLIDSGDYVPVRFSNFVAKVYMVPNSNDLGLTCTADGVTVVNSKEG